MQQIERTKEEAEKIAASIETIISEDFIAKPIDGEIMVRFLKKGLRINGLRKKAGNS